MGQKVARGDIFLINLDPVRGHEIQKTRPCLVISPDEMNRHLRTVIIAPMTTKGRAVPTRIPVHFSGKDGEIVLDQIRTVDRERLIKCLGHLDDERFFQVLEVLRRMFAP
jgi:mRNA interferase MazF